MRKYILAALMVLAINAHADEFDRYLAERAREDDAYYANRAYQRQQQRREYDYGYSDSRRLNKDMVIDNNHIGYHDRETGRAGTMDCSTMTFKGRFRDTYCY